jgi:hypothetical protein
MHINVLSRITMDLQFQLEAVPPRLFSSPLKLKGENLQNWNETDD